MPQQQFNGYTEDQMKRIASKLGHKGGLDTFDGYLSSNSRAMGKYNALKDGINQAYAKGGMVKRSGYAEGGTPGLERSILDKGKYIGGPVEPPWVSAGYDHPQPGYTNEDYFKEIAKKNPMREDRKVLSPTVPVAAKTTKGRAPINGGYVPPAAPTANKSLGDLVAGRATAPGLPTGTATMAMSTPLTEGQQVDSLTGQLKAAPTITAAQATTTEAAAPTVLEAPKVTTTKTKDVGATQAAKGTVSNNAQVNAATQDSTNVGDLDAAQGTATQVEGAPTRTLEGGELVNPVADAQKAAQFTEQITAAQADPSSKATVQGQLATLMTSFENGKTPAWAAGAMRNVTAQMAARGIGSSSMAGQALIQTALEASLPIATADAQTFASFEMTNLNNRQQRAMLSAQQRAQFIGQEFDQGFQSRVINATKISEVANMRFTADQQIALENSQAVNTMRLSNLSNRQAIVMAEASTLSQLDLSSLNNRQASAQQNAQSFLDMDMANTSNAQQAVMFDSQSRIQSMLTDAAADNASKQFNATSQQQTDQFFSNMKSNVSQFNASQANAQAQFNSGESNSISKFNSELSNQREQFNSQNRIVIDQSNAQWRRDIATADTAAVNRSNEINAKSLLDISNNAYNDLWQDYRDKSEWAWNSAENGRDRFTKMAMQKMIGDSALTIAQMEADYKSSSDLGGGLFKLLLSPTTGTILGDIF